MVDSYKDNTFDDSHLNNQSIDQHYDLPQIAILGGSFVGKTSIFNQILGHATNEPLEQGIINQKQIKIEKNEEEIEFNLMDFPGCFDCDQIIIKSIGFLLVFAVDDRQSFLKMQDIYQKIQQIHGKSIHKKIIVIGNKNDLPKNEKVVKKKEIEEFYTQNKQEYWKLPQKNQNAVQDMFKKLKENICNEAKLSLSKSNILSKSLTVNSPYGTHFMTQTGVSKSHKNSVDNKDSKQKSYCQEKCNCSIF
ncbi:small GTP-binding domain protein (macronuclear) [Tetrahymena thermophila SB210]|uniref:Small GTP-binding domain protein n=1 Tax=Tetrahymena thermophila (strain SB210) TaxID=312017 RepID=I7MM94_TETTS|nr:small GTP-binding domain protein [Tetrahymena thermophila SB210]EAS04405.1 small GTP-binding domain protein [Tetrahymena thermophila SB210]|eukprot:XP_001024650.1 small GTP-binding domain protein [Tetrahymena thermophila SB210]